MDFFGRFFGVLCLCLLAPALADDQFDWLGWIAQKNKLDLAINPKINPERYSRPLEQDPLSFPEIWEKGLLVEDNESERDPPENIVLQVIGDPKVGSPFFFRDKKARFNGYAVDIIKHIVNKFPVEVNWIAGSQSAIKKNIRSLDYHIGVGGLEKSEKIYPSHLKTFSQKLEVDNQRGYGFVKYGEFGPNWFGLRTNSNKVKPTALRGKILGYLDDYEDEALDLQAAHQIKEIWPYTNTEDLIEDINSGQPPFGLMNDFQIMRQMLENPSRYVTFTGTREKRGAYFVVNPSYGVLKGWLRNQIEAMHHDGSLAKIRLKWFGKIGTYLDNPATQLERKIRRNKGLPTR